MNERASINPFDILAGKIFNIINIFLRGNLWFLNITQCTHQFLNLC